MLRNSKGFIHIGAIIFIFALIGIWFVYKSYQEDKLKEKLAMVINDYKTIVLSAIKDPNTQYQVEQLFQRISSSSDIQQANMYITKLKELVFDNTGVVSNPAYIQQKIKEIEAAVGSVSPQQ